MSLLGWIIVIVGALIVGIAMQLLIGTPDAPYRWIITSIAAFIGAVACSEWLFLGATPDLEGIAIWPALVGGLAVGIVVDLVAVWFLRGSEARGTTVR